MNNWKMRLAAFMQGRYGMDALYKGLIAIYFALIVLNLFLGISLLFYLSLLVLGLAIYRVFSRQTAKRAKENAQYIAWRDKAKKRIMLIVNRVKFFRTHRYRTCPNCKTSLRLQKKIGTMTINCPVCHTTFQATIKH